MRIVIVGSGFGGVKAALELSKRQIGSITLISKTPYFLHPSSLIAAATGKNTDEATVPLGVIFANHPNVRIIEDTITEVSSERRLVSSDSQTYPYDKLILAMGTTTSYDGIKGLSRNAFDVKTLSGVTKFQDSINDSVASKKLEQEYFVIGAGTAGVELAGALATYLKKLKALYNLKGLGPRVNLVEASDRITPKLSKTASAKIAKQLEKLGVKVITGKKVTALSDDTITIGELSYPTETAIWTSGAATPTLFKQYDGLFALNNVGLVKVNPYLEAFNDIYVIGDGSAVKYSGSYSAAVQQAVYVANAITRTATDRPLLKFKPKKPITSVQLGADWGYVERRGVYQAGRLGYRMCRMIELNSYVEVMSLKLAIPIWRAPNVVDVDDAK